MSTFAIDYDATWTADPEAFAAFASLLRRRGHRVIVITARVSGHWEVEHACRPVVDEVYFSGASYKREHAEANGETVDIWIDDMPGMIGPDIPLVGGTGETTPACETCDDCGDECAACGAPYRLGQEDGGETTP
jgi:hypothetical protein